MRELIRGNQQRLLSRDLDRVLDLEFPGVLITDGVNSPVMPMPLRGDRHCERLPAAPACIPKGVSRLDDETRLPKRDGAVQPPGRAPRRLHMHACNQCPSDCTQLAIIDYNEVASSGHEPIAPATNGNQRPSEAIRGHQTSSEVHSAPARASAARQSGEIRGHEPIAPAIRGHQKPSEAIRRHQRSSTHLHEPRPHVNRIGRAHRSAAPKSHVDGMLACDGRQQSDAIRGNQTSSEVISGRCARLRRQVAVAPPSSLLRVGRRAAGAKPRTRSTAPVVRQW